MKGEANALICAGVNGLHTFFQERAITPVEVLEAHLARIDRLNGGLNALVHDDFDRARTAARDSAARWAKGRARGLLDGVPIAVKANIALKGVAWTGALSGWRDRIAQQDAFVVARLRKAGAVVIGALNMHEAALGATNDSPLYGKAFNPLRAGFTPGGSSGGSGVAVAAGFVAAALGTDTMGSVRIPAAYCGGVGFKPSTARVSSAGVIPLSWSLDHVGLHARNVGDLRALLRACEGYERGDGERVDYRKPAKTKSFAELRIGRVRFEGHVGVEAEIAANFETVCAELSARGVKVLDVAADAAWFGPARRQGLLICEAEGAIVLGDLRGKPGAMSDALARLLDYGSRQSAEKLAGAAYHLKALRSRVRSALAAFDALILPTAPHTAFAFSNAAPASQADLTVFANVAGAPAVSLPMGSCANGLPTSLQVVCAPGCDDTAIDIAEAIEAFM
jgi:aspartyl-tRNA(Asn)/glutamyl-tRNA(Gln) amidotransferase subunit A